MEISQCETHQLIVRDKFGNCHKLVGRDGVDGKDGVDGVINNKGKFTAVTDFMYK